MLILPPLTPIMPPPRMMMAILAPKTAAFVTPKVDGDAMTLFETVCIMTPDIDKAVPATIAAMSLGILMR